MNSGSPLQTKPLSSSPSLDLFSSLQLTVLPTLLAQSSSPVASDKPLALFGAPPRVEQAISAAFSGMKLQVEHVEDIEAAKASVIDGSRVALLELEAGWPDTGKAIWYSKSSAEIGLYSTASAVLEAVAREERIRESGIDPALAAKLLSKPTFEVIKLEKGGEEKAQGQGDQAFLETLMTVLVFIMLLYMTILLYGQMIGRSVVTEKTSKTVEIMLSSVASRDLMIAKYWVWARRYASICGLDIDGVCPQPLSGAALRTRFARGSIYAKYDVAVRFLYPGLFSLFLSIRSFGSSQRG